MGARYVAVPRHDYTGEALDTIRKVFNTQYAAASNPRDSDVHELANDLAVATSELHEDGRPSTHREANDVVVILSAEADQKLEAEALDVASTEDDVEVEKSIVVNFELIIAVSEDSHDGDSTGERAA